MFYTIMDIPMTLLIALTFHLLGIIVWVGGMFFAYMALRPAAVKTLEPAQRLPLWTETFKRFFPWVWASIISIVGSGYYIIFGLIGGMAQSAVYIHVMQMLGIIMVLIFLHVFFAPYNRLKKAVAAEDWPTGAKALNQIRLLIGINLALGILTVLIAVIGRTFLQ